MSLIHVNDLSYGWIIWGFIWRFKLIIFHIVQGKEWRNPPPKRQSPALTWCLLFKNNKFFTLLLAVGLLFCITAHHKPRKTPVSCPTYDHLPLVLLLTQSLISSAAWLGLLKSKLLLSHWKLALLAATKASIMGKPFWLNMALAISTTSWLDLAVKALCSFLNILYGPAQIKSA